jgi:hypothetical protein
VTPTETETPTPTPTETPTETPTPTVTETPTETPTPTPTPTQPILYTINNNSTGDVAITGVSGTTGSWELDNGDYPILSGETGNSFSHPTFTNTGETEQFVITYSGINTIQVSITKNGAAYTPPLTTPVGQFIYSIDGPGFFIQTNDIIVITITDGV